MTSENPQNAGPPDLGSASGNKTPRRGGRATELTAEHEEILAGNAAGLARTALAEQTRGISLQRRDRHLAVEAECAGDQGLVAADRGVGADLEVATLKLLCSGIRGAGAVLGVHKLVQDCRQFVQPV